MGKAPGGKGQNTDANNSNGSCIFHGDARLQLLIVTGDDSDRMATSRAGRFLAVTRQRTQNTKGLRRAHCVDVSITTFLVTLHLLHTS